MKDYLKKHATQAAYTTWTSSNDYITPNVSLIDADGSLEYNPYIAAPISITASIGDILWSDLSVTSTATPTGSGVTPIGICCIATGDSNTDDGKARFMGLKYMKSSGPSTTPSTSMIWGPNTAVPNIHSGSVYYDTDYDGTGNTAAIVATGNLASYPAAYQCQQYAPTGTNAGDWYLPATQELKAVYTNESTINNQLTALRTDYSSDCMSTLDVYGNYWSSTERGYSDAYSVHLYSGDASSFSKDNVFRVLPMLKL